MKVTLDASNNSDLQILYALISSYNYTQWN